MQNRTDRKTLMSLNAMNNHQNKNNLNNLSVHCKNERIKVLIEQTV